MSSVKVTVPATSANLGPGFDSLGIAVGLYARFTFTPSEEKLAISGCPKRYQNEDNLVYVAFRAACDEAGQSIPGVHIHIDSDIPTARGLGSSAACLVGGAVGANLLMGQPLDNQALLNLVTRLEGHPDNVAPALLGGFTAAAMDKEQAIAVKFPVSDRVKLCALIPPFELSTELARKVLPESVAHKDATFNISRIPLLIKAFEVGSDALFEMALKDRLHQPYRDYLIENCKYVRMQAIAAGAAGVCISGAGPTLMAIHTDEAVPARLSDLASKTDSPWKVLSLQVDTRGAVWEEIQ